ncbi:cytochrome P450 monooxygenase-like protein [Hyaloscypha bicolor E]|uniref:Cytochrome P450 monooxygenase-like protein n=1 Tax=Hyaloscypha bicolor E TaxID=1095630 RepID=A0A2J6ST37_9HELO|nr:cytochrome P450 monooxygenase-like protein [Hyaloscypha bicolor E]PMD53922.1 cytochrome P450 monooxygenase-like protein [Hyaloscypha bicolor E]
MLLTILFSAIACYFVYSLGVALYNITLHPLAKIPGRKIDAAFSFPSHWDILTGDAVKKRKLLHDRYGHTVRVSPSLVSFTNAEAWQPIYGYQNPGRKQLDKGYYAEKGEVPSIFVANVPDHTRMRRLLNHAFSETALREQEPLMNSYFDLLIQKLHEKIGSPTNGRVNIVRWFNFTLFDLVGDLCFGEDFDALKTEDYNFWIVNIFKGVKIGHIFVVLKAYPLIGKPIIKLMEAFPALQKGREKHDQYSKAKSERRLDKHTDRKDFISYILRHNDEKGMSREEIIKTTNLLIIAGSETSATLLSGAMFYLLKNPSTLKKLKLAKMPYLNAVLQEALRVYPPAPGLFSRKMLPGGAVINGYFIPANASVGVLQYGAFRSASNFADPDSFIPERWLEPREERFMEDKRNVLQPFSVGPRNCIGQGLAMGEMRAILARVLWHFDFELCKGSENWDQQKVFSLWEKGDLWVRISKRGE